MADCQDDNDIPHIAVDRYMGVVRDSVHGGNEIVASGNVALSDLWCCRVWGRKRSAIGSPHVPSQLIGLNGAGLSAALLGDTTPWVVLYFTPPAASRGSTRGPAVPVRTWHATQCPIDVSASTCSCIEQDGWRKRQRVWKRQPLGG